MGMGKEEGSIVLEGREGQRGPPDVEGQASMRAGAWGGKTRHFLSMCLQCSPLWTRQQFSNSSEPMNHMGSLLMGLLGPVLPASAGWVGL